MKILSRIRLLPAVMAVGVALFGIKATGLVLDARAQEAGAAVSTSPAPAASEPASADNADDTDTTRSQVDVLTSLSKRRAELDARERDLEMRANLIAAAEKRVDGKIADLKQLQTQIQALLQQRDDAQEKEVTTLVKTYSSMKPKDAARIFNNLDENVLLAVAGAMKPDVLGAILALMQSEPAEKLTVRLANKLKLPDPPPAQQLSALIPPPDASAPSEDASATPDDANPPPPPPMARTASTAPILATPIASTPAANAPAPNAAATPAPAMASSATPAPATATPVATKSAPAATTSTTAAKPSPAPATTASTTPATKVASTPASPTPATK